MEDTRPIPRFSRFFWKFCFKLFKFQVFRSRTAGMVHPGIAVAAHSIVPNLANWNREFAHREFGGSCHVHWALFSEVCFFFKLKMAQKCFRSLIYPFLIREGKPTPIHLLALGFIFCSWNGYIQGFFHAKYAVYPREHFWTFGSLFGLKLIFFKIFKNQEFHSFCSACP